MNTYPPGNLSLWPSPKCVSTVTSPGLISAQLTSLSIISENTRRALQKQRWDPSLSPSSISKTRGFALSLLPHTPSFLLSHSSASVSPLRSQSPLLSCHLSSNGIYCLNDSCGLQSVTHVLLWLSVPGGSLTPVIVSSDNLTWLRWVCRSAGAAITKNHKLGVMNSRNSSHGSGG